MQLDVPQVAEITKLKTDHIRALENGDYSVFTAPIYLRGSLRTYGKALKLDVAALLAQLDAELGASGGMEEPTLSPPRARSGLDSFMLMLSRVNWPIALGVLLIALLVAGGLGSYRAWIRHKNRDPLRNLQSGIYQPPAESGELIPGATNPPRR